ncbi:hypothetical protein [Parasitella parasitica]|uniref:Uncharacterized protein n=1 Tax=Parasitella parasitica TaxID=35722 RepID=A0A0B7NHC3_9FUNG|nr:hypothetical protein [Parasitella parasitica]
MTDQLLNTIDEYVGLQGSSIALLSLAVLPIVAGSICSLKLLQNPNELIKTEKKSPSPRNSRARSRSRSRSASTHRYHTRSHDYSDSSSDDDDLIEKVDVSKVVDIKDTFLFPIIASGLVYAVSYLIETVDPLYVNNFFMVLTSILSMTVLSSTAAIVAEAILPKRVFDNIGRFKFSYTKRDKKLCHLNVTLIHLLIIAVSIGLAATYALTQHWVIGNLFAISLAIQAIRCFTLDSLGTGYMLLCGIFIAYCLRVDKLNAWKNHKHESSFKKPYFTLSLVAYALTAGASIYTVHFTKKSQSAFLYVVPALILSTLVLATYRGELSAVWDYSEILDTFKELNGYHLEEYRPTREERLSDRHNTRISRSASAGVRRGSTVGVVEEAFDETRKVVAPILGEAADATLNAAEEARKAMVPYYEEAVRNTTRAVHAVATKVQEQTALDEDTTIEQDVIAQHKNDGRKPTARGSGRGRGRGRGRSRSTSVAARKRSSSRANKRD